MRNKSRFFGLILTFFILISTATTYSHQVIYVEKSISVENSKIRTSFSPVLRWQNNGTLLSNASNSQEGSKLSSDGNGGAIITWIDYRDFGSSNLDIYAQRINTSGELMWSENGTIICNEVNVQTDPEIADTENDSAVIIWVDNRGADKDIFAQKINGSGDTLWVNNGTVICNATDVQDSPKVISDGDGGAIIVWIDRRNGADYDIFAQRIDKNGNNLWGSNGTVVCNATSDQISPQIVSGGNESAIITWVDNRGGDKDIYAQKINGSGTLWINNGTLICNATKNQDTPQLCSDGNGGAIITWADNRSDTSGFDIYAQSINSTGYIKWINNGTVICNATNVQTFPQLCSDDNGGAIITWQDYQSGTNWDVYAQRINKVGTTLWFNNGTPINTKYITNQNSPQICTNRMGGAFITWIDYRYTLPSIFMQAVGSIGDKQWAMNGISICENNFNRFSVEIISDGDRGAIISWVDNRTGIDTGIYGHKIVYNTPSSSSSPLGRDLSESFQETFYEFSEALTIILFYSIIIIGILGLALLSIKIGKKFTKKSRKWG